MLDQDTTPVNTSKQYTWLKLHCKFLHNPTIRMLEEKYQFRLILLWILRRQNYIPNRLSDEEIAFKLNISLDELQKTKAILLKKKLITKGWDIPNWDKYQANVKDKSSNVRVSKYRERISGAGISYNTSQKVRYLIFQRDGDSCMYCGVDDEKMCIDHLIPFDRIKRDPESLKIYQSPDNLVASCRSCNVKKSRMLPEEIGFTFRNPDMENTYLSTKSKIFDENALKNNLDVKRSVTVTPIEVTVTRVTPVTVTSNSETVSSASSDYWPDGKTIKTWETLYPLVNVQSRLDYIKKHFQSGAIDIKNKTTQGIDKYLMKSLQTEQKDKEDAIDKQAIDDLKTRYNGTSLNKLGDLLLYDVIFNDLPHSHAYMAAKACGLSKFTIRDHIALYRTIVNRAKEEPNFNINTAEHLAKQGGVTRLNPAIKVYVESLDDKKKNPRWKPE